MSTKEYHDSNTCEDSACQEELCSKEVPCNRDGCTSCCEHNEHDHFICLDCGEELDPGGFIDDAMSRFED